MSYEGNEDSVYPVSDRVLVKISEQSESKSSGGLYLPKSEEKVKRGKVVRVGKSSDDSKPIALKEDDYVIFNSFSGTAINKAGDLIILREEDCLAIIKTTN